MWGMILYGIGLMPLAEALRQSEPSVLQPWYVEDFALQGPGLPHCGPLSPALLLWPKRGILPRAGEMLGHLPSLLGSERLPSLPRRLAARELLPRAEIRRRLRRLSRHSR